jgi:hypothetical protein
LGAWHRLVGVAGSPDPDSRLSGVTLPPLSGALLEARHSGIREIGNLAAGRPGCIRLEAGQPDFRAPAHVAEAAKRAIDDGWTSYTHTQGLASLREALAEKIQRVNGYAVGPDEIACAGGGVGAIAAALVVAQRGLPRRHMTFMYVTWTAATLSIAGYGVATRAWELVAASLAFNALEAAGTIAWATTKHRRVPSELLGRVSSLDWFISIALLPVSYALTAPVAAAIGPRATLVGAGLVGAGVTLGFLFLPGMRQIERDGDVSLGAGVALDGTA